MLLLHEDSFGTKNEHTCRRIHLFHKVLTNIGTLKSPHTHRKIEKWNLFPFTSHLLLCKILRIGLSNSLSLVMQKSVTARANSRYTCIKIKGLFTWSGGPRSSGVGFFCFHALGDTKQKKLTPLERVPPLHVNRV